jgi:hypothetical protein
MDGYEIRGDPDVPFVPSKRDTRVQEQAVAVRESVRRSHFHQYTTGESAGSFFSHTHDDDEPGHQHPGRQAFPARADSGYFEESGPSLGTALPAPVASNITRALQTMRRLPDTPLHQRMRWCLRLYCGHVVERTAHVDHRTIHAAVAAGIVCPECGPDPATIVAGRALGAAASPPQAAAGKSPKRARTGSLERRLARAKAEVAGLEAELDHES